MALFTCMWVFATLEVVLQVFLENLFLSLINGGMISLDTLLTSRPLMLNPISAIKLLPNLSFSTIPKVSVMQQSDSAPSIALGD